MGKLFITDMDGTLLNAKKELPADFAETVKAVEANNGVFSFASGRSYLGLRSMYGHYSDRFGYICDNGAMVVYDGKVLKADILSENDLREIAAQLSISCRMVLAFCGINTVYVMRKEPMDADQIRELSYYYPVYEEVEKVEEISDDILKVAILYNDGVEDNIYPYLQLNDGLDYLCTAYNWVDVMKKGISKGKGVAALQEYLGASADVTYVFGDYFNDLSMAGYTNHSFAMENAVDEVKEAFTKVIGSNEDGAVTKQIKMILEG